MSKIATGPQQQSLAATLSELADEVDGIVDLGMTVCLMDDDRMAGRHDYISQRAEKIRAMVKVIAGRIDRCDANHASRLAAQTDLSAGADRLVRGFESLERFRTLGTQALGDAIEAVRAGWEATHASIAEAATLLGLLHEPWYSAVRGRQATYRTHVDQLDSWFSAAVHE